MDAEQILAEAENATKQGAYETAGSLLKQGWPDPSRAPPDVQHAFAMVRHAQGQHGEAEKLMRAALAADPRSLRHNIALGHILAAAGNLSAATDAYAEALRIDAKWPGLRLVHARMALDAGRIEEAEASARKAAKEGAGPDAWDTLSGALRMQKKGQDALAAADEALKLAPNHASALNSRGASLLMLKREREALAIFDALIDRGLAMPVLWLNRGAALELLGRRAEADAVYADAAARWPHYPNLQQHLAARRR